MILRRRSTGDAVAPAAQRGEVAGASSDCIRRLPNLVIVGVSKAGTTSLFHYLGQHPDICPADLKELRYFIPLRYGGSVAPVETYAAHFRHCTGEKYAVEATPGYFYGGRPLALGLRDTCPDVRALVSLRRPQDRCWSWYQFMKSRARIPEEMTFDGYLDRCEQLHRAGTDGAVEHQPFWGLGGGCYATCLADWIDVLGDHFRIVFFEDFSTDPLGTLKAICEWLDLDRDSVDRFEFAVDNKTTQYYSRRLQKAALTLNRSQSGERFFHKHRTLKRNLRRVYYSVNKAPTVETMTPAQRTRLAAFYQPYNERLAPQLATVGLRLPPAWSLGGEV